MSENELTINQAQSLIPLDSLAQNEHANLATFKENVASGKYLPYLKLYGSSNKEVKQRLIAAAHWGVVQNQKITDLGEEFVALAIAWRWKAVEIIGDDFHTFYNPTTPSFQRIKDLSSVKDSGCMYGPEFLLWLPDQKQFVTYHMNNASARSESNNLLPMLGKAVQFKWRLADNKKHQWEAPVVLAYSTPIEIPDLAEIKSVSDSFAKPEDSKVEQAGTEQAAAASSDRR